MTRIELAFSAWEADVLPLNYTRGTVRTRRPWRWSPARTSGSMLDGESIDGSRRRCRHRPAVRSPVSISRVSA